MKTCEERLMGAILESTPAMGPWGVEVRRESFYLMRSDCGLPDTGNAPPATGDHAQPGPFWSKTSGGVSFLLADAKSLGAALDLVASHRAFQEWSKDFGRVGPKWEVEAVEDERVWLRGPVIAYGHTTDWLIAQSVEICYENLEELRERVAALG